MLYYEEFFNRIGQNQPPKIHEYGLLEWPVLRA